ncbi:hypothetical protein [Chryseobacterium sp. RR2-3-20]|uniref:hypothetical protein n=1 Tax=Chryseobacterium sp. RR2-3-20 TaxID=2787626 RepID=UPI001ADF472F|nr:hypothetical protein [Chryseobacterium sp. RR2-3-20]
MKTIKLLLVFLLSIPYTVNAQEEVADYKQFETLAKKVNSINYATNGKIVKNNNDDIAIKNPKNNFMFNYNDLTVNYINGIEGALLVYENMDLAEIEEVGILDEAIGECGMVILTPKNKQKFTIVVDGKPTTNEIDAIGFYFPYNDKAKGKEMFEALSELIYLCKIKKGISTKKETEQELALWQKIHDSNNLEEYYAFIKKYPKSIFKLMAEDRAEALDSNIHYFTKDYTGFHLGMSENDFKQLLEKKVKEVAANTYKMDKNLKLFLDNYKVEFTNKAPYSLYYFENYYPSVLYSDIDINAGSLTMICAENNLRLDCLSDNTATYAYLLNKIDIKYKKLYQLQMKDLPVFFHTILNTQGSDLQKVFVPSSVKSMPTEFAFNKNNLTHITYSYVIGNSYQDGDDLLRPIYNAFGTPFLEKKYIPQRETIAPREGKVAYFDRGKYYILAKAIRQYSSSPFDILSTYMVTLTIHVKQ